MPSQWGRGSCKETSSCSKTSHPWPSVFTAHSSTRALCRPKEKRLIELVKAEKAKGRRVLVFVQSTDKRNVTARYVQLLEREGLRAAVLKSHTTSAENREAWVKTRVGEGIDTLICHPRVVQTDLDLLEFPTIVYMQVKSQCSPSDKPADAPGVSVSGIWSAPHYPPRLLGNCTSHHARAGPKTHERLAGCYHRLLERCGHSR